MYDVIVVGAGIAGMTSALYAARLELKTLILSRDIGGQLMMAPEIQNYPGFISIRGSDLALRVMKQVEGMGVEIRIEEVVNVKEEKGFIVYTAEGSQYETLALIFAFGKTPIELNVPGEKRLKGKGVSYCTICDAPLYKDKIVALMGLGEVGLHAASVLSKVVRKCYWIFPGPTPGAISPNVMKYVKEKGNVVLMPHTQVVEIKGNGKVSSILVKSLKSGEVREIEVAGVFVEMGYKPKTDFLRGFVDLNEKGEIIVNSLCETSRKGVFAAGDVTNIPYKQAVISAGQGAIAALSAYNYVAQIKGYNRVDRDWKHLRVKHEEEGGGLFLRI